MAKTTICRPFITLRNGKVLLASSVGLQAFCFEVDEVRPKKQKSPQETEETQA
ncbi:MAG TPA: hypothetical protein VL576_00365 [Candidatus Paceibacterota bacterium]|jgi:hypothetical protein|nr:hypothetical protein [Candidatus Paceibacterota bacterium]